MPRKTIFIIEDDDAIRMNLKQEVESEGFDVIVAGDGKEALEVFPHILRPCMILLDLLMPVMDGFEFMTARKHDRQLSKVPVVIVSAFPEKAKIIQAEGHIKKPIDLDLLFQMISSICGPADSTD